jgi:hypothetical protein
MLRRVFTVLSALSLPLCLLHPMMFPEMEGTWTPATISNAEPSWTIASSTRRAQPVATQAALCRRCGV